LIAGEGSGHLESHVDIFIGDYTDFDSNPLAPRGQPSLILTFTAFGGGVQPASVRM
jgi:hypothetical protein